jgi:hypothetical protein
MRYTYSMNQSKCYLYSFSEQDCAADKWDYGLLKEIFDKYEIEQIRETSIPKSDRGFVVIPGPQNLGHEEDVNKEIQNLSRIVLFITGDEEGKFDITKINHPNAEIWIQYPHEKHKDYNKLPIGVPQHLKKLVLEYPSKDNDLYFGGQITHARRQQLANAIQAMPNALFKPTAGFAQGDKPVDYYRTLASAKIAPAPSGAEVIDSFRFYEAIEMLCLPVADKIDPKGNSLDFYQYVFGYDIPVSRVSNWSELHTLVPELLNKYPQNMHKVVAWWIKYKRDLGIKIMRQVNE